MTPYLNDVGKNKSNLENDLYKMTSVINLHTKIGD